MEQKSPLSMVQLNSENLQYFTVFFPEEYLRSIETEEISGIGVVYENISCGVLLYNISEDTVKLHWLYMAPDYRRKGFAAFLHSRIRIYAKVYGCDITTVLPITENNEDVLSFLRSEGYAIEENGAGFEFSLKNIDTSRFVRNTAGKAYTLQEAGSINAFLNQLRKDGELLIDPEEISEMSPYLSTITVHDANVSGCMLIRQEDAKNAEIAFLYLDGNSAAKSAVDFMNMLNRSIESAEQIGIAKDITIHASCVTPTVAKLVKNFVKGARETVFYRGIILNDKNLF